MRQIKSRFWDRRNEKWEVFHIEIEVDPTTHQGDAKLFHVAPDHGIGILPAPDLDPASRGEFTGLKDKNGKEIYEGDIVEDPEYGDRQVVAWHEWNYLSDVDHMHVVGFSFEFYPEAGQRGIQDFQVIGNIYENPDLL